MTSGKGKAPAPEVVRCSTWQVMRTHQCLGKRWFAGTMVVFNHEPPSHFKRNSEQVGTKRIRMIPTDELQYEIIGREPRVVEAERSGKEYVGEIGEVAFRPDYEPTR